MQIMNEVIQSSNKDGKTKVIFYSKNKKINKKSLFLSNVGLKSRMKYFN